MGHARVRLSILVLAIAAAVMATVAGAPPTSAATAPLIVIDPGHGGRYSNANANGLKEKNVNLAIALELRRQLVARGYRVTMTRTTDRAVTLSDIRTWNWSDSADLWRFAADGHKGIYRGIPKDDLQARVNVANKAGADLFISIHNNGAANRAARGTETYAAPRDALGKRAAALVHRQIVKRTRLRDRGVGAVDYYVCRWTHMPAILVEGAFISNPSDARLLKSSTFRRKIAIGIAEGVDEWFDDRPFTRIYKRTTTTSAASAAVMSSRAAFSGGAKTVVVARSDTWAQVPSAPAFAAKLKAPLLWVSASGPDTSTAVELGRLEPERIIYVGVNGSLDDSATAAVADASAVATSAVEQVGGVTPADVAASVATSMGVPASRHVFVVSSADTASMRAAATVAAARGIPILLADSGELPEAGRQFLANNAATISGVKLIGRASALSSAKFSGQPGLERFEGVDFAHLASKLNTKYYPSKARNSLVPTVADSAYGAEYLTAARYSASITRPVMPVRAGVMPDFSRLWITNRRTQISRFEVYNARGSIPLRTDHMLRKADYGS